MLNQYVANTYPAQEIEAVQIRPSDPACHDQVAVLAGLLVGACLDIHQQPGEAGEDAAWRAVARAIHGALTEEFDADEVAAFGAVRKAVDEIGRDVALTAD